MNGPDVVGQQLSSVMLPPPALTVSQPNSPTPATSQKVPVAPAPENPYAARAEQADLRYHNAVNRAMGVDDNGNPLIDPTTGKPLQAAANVNPSWLRTVLAIASSFGKRGSAINNVGQALGQAILTRDPRWQEAQQRLANVNMTHQEAEETRAQAQTAAMDAYRQGIILQRELLAQQKQQAAEEKQQQNDQAATTRAVGKGFTPSTLPMTMENPAAVMPSGVNVPSAIQKASAPPIQTNVPEGRGELPPNATLPHGAPAGATPALVAGQTGYYPLPSDLAAQRVTATRNANLQTIGVAPPEDIRKAFPGLGDKILPSEIPQLEAYIKAKTQQTGGQNAVAQTMGKLWGNGISDAGSIEDPNKALAAIQMGVQRGVISQEEGQLAAGFYQTHNTPASVQAAGIARMAQLANQKGATFLDSDNGNAPVMLNWNQINQANHDNPGRMVPSGSGAQALKSTALMEDLRGGAQQVRNSLGKMTDQDFSVLSRADISLALRSADPRSAIQSLVTGGALANLRPEQQDYVINLAVLKENAMAMRSVLGAGQGSEDLRSAIERTIPSASTPDRGFAVKQLDAFGGVLDRLQRGIPKVQLRNDIGTGNAPASGGGITVTDPHGGVHTFRDQASADRFKALAKIP
jgi:hypothetical protein